MSSPWSIGSCPASACFCLRLFGHVFVPVAGMFWFWSRKLCACPAWLSFALMAVFTALAELYVPMLFKWNFGYSWYGAGLPIYQWAEMIGFTGLSMLTILTNFLVLLAWRERDRTLGQIRFCSHSDYFFRP